MGLLKLTAVSLTVVIVSFLVYRLTIHTSYSTFPGGAPDWRNFGKLSDEDAQKASGRSAESFEVKVSDEQITDYMERLKHARISPPLRPEVNMTYGYPSSAINGLRERLLQFDMRAWATRMNTLNHYRRNIFGLNIHYIKVSGKQGLRRVPLLLIHGWPGSIYEFYEAVPHLQSKAEEQGFTYDIIIPSLPGYGFSEAPYHAECSPRYIAAMLAELMKHEFPGGEKFIVQGGDWGALITEWIVGLYPDRLLGFHTNMFTPPRATDDMRLLPWQMMLKLAPDQFMSEGEKMALDKHGLWSGVLHLILHEFGYFHLQATKPDTVGAGLSDSPLGLAVYIIEKFYTWADMDNVNMSIEQATERLKYSIDRVLDNIMIYWYNNAITSSMRLYKEAIRDFDSVPYQKTNVPAGVLMNIHELTFTPQIIVQLKCDDLRRYTLSTTGGHFAAFEEPQKFSDEIVAFTLTLL